MVTFNFNLSLLLTFLTLLSTYSSLFLVKGETFVPRQFVCCIQLVTTPTCDTSVYERVNTTCGIQLDPETFQALRNLSVIQIKHGEENTKVAKKFRDQRQCKKETAVKPGQVRDKKDGNKHIKKRCSPSLAKWIKNACVKRNLFQIKRVVMDMLDVNCTLDKDVTLIMFLSKSRWTEGFDFFVQQKCDLKARDADSSTVLYHAAAYGALDIVKKLVDTHCMDMECKNNKGQTPLMGAVRHGHYQVVELLVEKGADVNTEDIYNSTLLDAACFGRQGDILKYVLSLNIIDVDHKGLYERTPLINAAFSGHLHVFVILLQHHADVTATDEDGANVLHVACAHGHLALVKFMISHEGLRGLQKMRDKFGKTPIQRAIFAGNNNVVAFLKSMRNEINS